MDSQVLFDKTFGLKPKLLLVHPVGNNFDSICRVLRDFLEGYKLDILCIYVCSIM